MTTKADFSAEEWSTLMQAPLAASLYISLADPSFFGAFGEVFSVTRQLVAEAQAPSENELLGAMLAEFKDMAGARAAQPSLQNRDPAGARAELLEQIERAVALLNTRATQAEATDIKQRLYQFAQGTAEASKEGGFLGMGGTRVSAAETAALGELAGVLGMDTPSMDTTTISTDSPFQPKE
jgi:hypothetical protein